MAKEKPIVEVRLDVEELPEIVVGNELTLESRVAWRPTDEFLELLKKELEEHLGGEFKAEFDPPIKEALKNLKSGMDFLKVLKESGDE